MATRTPITPGDVFGRLVALSRNPDREKHWVFRCQCGVEKSIRADEVKDGRTKSCGCLRRERPGGKQLMDLSGLRFGRLSVLEQAEHPLAGPHGGAGASVARKLPSSFLRFVAAKQKAVAVIAAR